MHSLSKYDVSEETKMWSQNKWGASWRSTWWENFAFWFLLFSENVGLRRQRVTERTQNTKRDLSSFRLKPQSFHKISRRRKVWYVKLSKSDAQEKNAISEENQREICLKYLAKCLKCWKGYKAGGQSVKSAEEEENLDHQEKPTSSTREGSWKC